MALGKRLINTGGAAVCTTDTADIFGDSSGVALYNLDYDASDASGNYDGTPTNVDFGVDGQINYGARFNGSAYVTYNSFLSTTTDNSSASFSIWVKFNSFSSIQAISSGLSGQSPPFNLYVYHSGGTSTFAIERGFGGTIHYSSTYNTEIQASTSVDTWYHIVYTYTASTKAIEVFLNGNSIGTDTLNASTSGTISSTQLLGGRNGGGSIDADLDQYRIFSKALDETTNGEVSALYAETACVYTATTTDSDYPTTNAAYYKLDNSAEDSKGTNDGTEYNIEYRFGRFGQAAVFNGSSSKIDLGNNSSNNSSVISVSLWFKTAGHSGTAALINNGGANSGETGYFLGLTSNGYIRLNLSASVDGTINYADGNWHNVVMTLNNGSYNVYIDGNTTPVLTGSQSFTGTATRPTWIGQFSYTASNLEFFDGSIDQVRIYDAALSSSQVTELYNEKPEVDTSNFKTVLYEGTGASQYISNVGFQPDLVWIKNRDTSGKWHSLADSVRGGGKRIFPNEDDAESTDTFDTQSFEANGFIIGNGDFVSRNNESHVAWVWKGSNADAVLNTQGSIDSQVSANTEAGFSIVKFSGGNSSGTTVGHGLNTPIELLIVKNLNDSSDNWITWHKNIEQNSTSNNTFTLKGGSVVLLNSTSATIPSYSYDGQMGATSGENLIAYCWHSVAGYSKIGSYEGSGSSQSIYVTDDDTSTGSGGFQPSFVMIKNIDAAANWMMYDAVRDSDGTINLFLEANTSDDEASAATATISPISNGFTIGNSNSIHINDSTDTYIYMAFK